VQVLQVGGRKADNLALQQIIAAKSKEVETGWQIWQNFLRNAVTQKVLICQ
jgi:hypothetical protein